MNATLPQLTALKPAEALRTPEQIEPCLSRAESIKSVLIFFFSVFPACFSVSVVLELGEFSVTLRHPTAGVGAILRRLLSILPWPKPRGGPHHAACHFCDTLHDAVVVQEGVAAGCACCGAKLYQNRPASLARATAFSITAIILMVMVHIFPFLTMDAAGMRTSLSLTHAAGSLIEQGSPILGIAVAIFTIIAPVVMALGLIYVCGPLMYGRAAPGAMEVARWLSRMEPWNMIEVFLLGVLVSLLKLTKVADMQFGLGFWAFAVLMLSMAAAVASIDRDELWDRLEVAQP